MNFQNIKNRDIQTKLKVNVRKKPVICSSSSTAFLLLKPYISSLVEEFWVIALGPSHHVLGLKKLFKGTVDSCFFHPRDLFRTVIEKNASCFLVAHNHPSSCLKPSLEDIEVTIRIQEGAKLMGIHFIDHLILSTDSYCSLSSLGYLNKNLRQKGKNKKKLASHYSPTGSPLQYHRR